MSDSRRGKKTNTDKNPQARQDFLAGKKIGRPKQRFVPNLDPPFNQLDPKGGTWEKMINAQPA